MDKKIKRGARGAARGGAGDVDDADASGAPPPASQKKKRTIQRKKASPDTKGMAPGSKRVVKQEFSGAVLALSKSAAWPAGSKE